MESNEVNMPPEAVNWNIPVQYGHGPELALFNAPPVNIAIAAKRNVDFAPTNPLSANNPMEFSIYGNANTYIDMKKIRLHLKVKIKKGSANLEDTDMVTFANSPYLTLFSACELYLNQRQVESVNA